MTEPVLQGSLSSFKLPEVLTFLSTSRRSGTLTLRGEERESYVFFQNGALVYAGSNSEEFRLSAILLRKKRISREQQELIDGLMRREGRRFGQIATQEGVLTEDQLKDFLKVQVSEILYDSFVWPGGTFAFAEEVNLPSYAVTIAVDLSNLIMEGARRIEEWEQCLRLLPDKEMVFHVVSNPSEEKITLTADEWKILFLINGSRTLDELCQDAQEDALHVYRVVYGLFANKLIEAARGGEAGGSDSQSGDETIIQGAPAFGAESTMREIPEDDTNLLVSSAARLSYRDVIKPTVAQLVMTTGAADGTVLPLIEAEYLIGRQQESAIALADPGVSGFHARIYRGPDGYAIEDLKSRNGTWVNEDRILHAVLAHGDQLRLGATELRYEVLFKG